MDNVEFQRFVDENHFRLSRFERLLKQWGKVEVDLDAIDLTNPDSLKLASGTTDPDFQQSIEDLNLTLQEIFQVFLNSESDQREMLVDLIESKDCVMKHLVIFPDYAANQIHTGNDERWVKAGAVAALIEDGRTDFRDLWVSLGTLYCKAKSCGINLEQLFAEVEALGSPDNDFFDSGKLGRGILSDFLKSDYLASLHC
jgi:hypothetical protein